MAAEAVEVLLRDLDALWERKELTLLDEVRKAEEALAGIDAIRRFHPTILHPQRDGSDPVWSELGSWHNCDPRLLSYFYSSWSGQREEAALAGLWRPFAFAVDTLRGAVYSYAQQSSIGYLSDLSTPPEDWEELLGEAMQAEEGSPSDAIRHLLSAARRVLAPKEVSAAQAPLGGEETEKKAEEAEEGPLKEAAENGRDDEERAAGAAAFKASKAMFQALATQTPPLKRLAKKARETVAREKAEDEITPPLSPCTIKSFDIFELQRSVDLDSLPKVEKEMIDSSETTSEDANQEMREVMDDEAEANHHPNQSHAWIIALSSLDDEEVELEKMSTLLWQLPSQSFPEPRPELAQSLKPLLTEAALKALLNDHSQAQALRMFLKACGDFLLDQAPLPSMSGDVGEFLRQNGGEVELEELVKLSGVSTHGPGVLQDFVADALCLAVEDAATQRLLVQLFRSSMPVEKDFNQLYAPMNEAERNELGPAMGNVTDAKGWASLLLEAFHSWLGEAEAVEWQRSHGLSFAAVYRPDFLLDRLMSLRAQLWFHCLRAGLGLHHSPLLNNHHPHLNSLWFSILCARLIASEPEGSHLYTLLKQISYGLEVQEDQIAVIERWMRAKGIMERKERAASHDSSQSS